MYSASQFDADRKSTNADAKARAALFSHGSFYKDGYRYQRQEITQNGQKYFRFVRSNRQ